MSESKRARDRASMAFRRWARAGCPAGNEIREDGSDTEKDFRACAAVFDVLSRQRETAEILTAIKGVYMEEPWRKLHKSEVTLRVRRIAVERYVPERRVYRWLARGRRLWWELREKEKD